MSAIPKDVVSPLKDQKFDWRDPLALEDLLFPIRVEVVDPEGERGTSGHLVWRCQGDGTSDDLSFEGENALVWEAKTASSRGERDRARKLYQTAYKRSPEAMPASAHFAYAQMLGSSMESRQHYRMAVDKAPLTPVYRWSLGEALEKSSKEGEKEEAELHKAIALELDPYVERDHGRIVITMD